MVPLRRGARHLRRFARPSAGPCGVCPRRRIPVPVPVPVPVRATSQLRTYVSATVPLRTPSEGSAGAGSTPDEVLSSFANLDHSRASRAGFPEAVFGQGKTPAQLKAILESMASAVNDRAAAATEAGDGGGVDAVSAAIIATRVDRDAYEEVAGMGPLAGGEMEYHDTARILSVRADAMRDANDGSAAVEEDGAARQSVVVACAGTTDLPVAEEAALTLELSGVPVTRVYDCGVAGLHRILSNLPKLRDPTVGCVIVCAGMDGALPSVVGGLVDVPVVAVPTSVGYGMSLGGMSALLTMLNSCSPGVGVVNVDNGFGGAVWAMKCLNSGRK